MTLVHDPDPMTQHLPEVQSTDRMHELSADCWCEPSVERVLRHRGPVSTDGTSETIEGHEATTDPEDNE